MPSRRQRLIGWAAVALTALVASFFASLAGGELPTDPWPMLVFHLIEMPVVLGLAAAALRWPRAIGVLIALGGPVGIAIPLFFFSTVSNQGVREKLAVLPWPIVATFVATGILLFIGRPRPSRLGYGIVIGVPLGLFAVSALVTALFPPTY